MLYESLTDVSSSIILFNKRVWHTFVMRRRHHLGWVQMLLCALKRSHVDKLIGKLRSME